MQDSAGNNAWDIAGREWSQWEKRHIVDTVGWDSQLIARESTSSAPLEVDTQVAPSQKEYLLLWRNSEKPKAPFNLTPYAITLVSWHRVARPRNQLTR